MTLKEMKEILIELKEEEHELQEKLYYCQGNIGEFEEMIEEERRKEYAEL